LIFQGETFDDAREHCERLALEEGYRYVHAVNEPLLIAGVGTAALEIIEDLPDIDIMILPLGGGSGISGACVVAKAVDPSIEVYAVQSESAPAAYLSWKQGEIVEAATETFAEGIATKAGYELPQRIMAEMLDDFFLVSDDDIRRAIGILVEKAHTLAEPAGATALAGAVRHAERLRGKKVSITVSGANITAERLAEALAVYQESSG
jgi:threonine dehydratase